MGVFLAANLGNMNILSTGTILHLIPQSFYLRLSSRVEIIFVRSQETLRAQCYDNLIFHLKICHNMWKSLVA